MKKLFLLSIMLVSAFVANAQNLQVHYDFGRAIYSDEEATRQRVTLTFEQFKADKLGSWFWFIDLDMYHDGMKGAYTEISREFTAKNLTDNLSLAAHVEYDGGMTTFKPAGGTRFQNAALVPALPSMVTVQIIQRLGRSRLCTSSSSRAQVAMPMLHSSSQESGASTSLEAREHSLASSISGVLRQPITMVSFR